MRAADCGDNVIVINAGKATLSGKKLEQKMYRTHSGWVGGLKDAAGKHLDPRDRGFSTASAVQIGLLRLIHIPLPPYAAA